MEEYFTGLLVEDLLVVEWTCAERLVREHTAQCLNYLRASGRTLCLLVNFQKPKVEWSRIVLGFQSPQGRHWLNTICLSIFCLDITLAVPANQAGAPSKPTRYW